MAASKFRHFCRRVSISARYDALKVRKEAIEASIGVLNLESKGPQLEVDPNKVRRNVANLAELPDLIGFKCPLWVIRDRAISCQC
jgi:hypothetical protein